MKNGFILFQDDWIIWFHTGRDEVLSDEEEYLRWTYNELKVIHQWQTRFRVSYI